MYRTARVGIYDVLDTIFCNIVITEYPGTPGQVEPDVFAYSTSVDSIGDEHPAEWAQRALESLVETLKHA